MSLAAELPIFQACPWQHGNQGLCIYSLRKSVIAWYCHCKSLSYMVSHICFVLYNVAKASYVMSYIYIIYIYIRICVLMFCIRTVFA